MAVRGLVLLAASAAVALGGKCNDYYKVTDGSCGQACLGSSVGFCPIALIVKEGGLKEGTCEAQGFNTQIGYKDIKAGPCGHINFTEYNQTANMYARGSGGVSGSKCPTVTPIPDLNITEWIRSSWFIQEQQVTGYQKVNDLFCVSATYDDQEGSRVPFFGGKVLSVFNYANKGKVNGEATNKDNATILCARQPDEKVASKLLVAPCFLPNVLAGPYWVLAAGPSPSNYEWAVVSGGQPTEQYADGCTTKETGTNGSGFWLMSRNPIATGAVMQQLRNVAQGLGFTLSRLHKVPQAGCMRQGSFIKN